MKGDAVLLIGGGFIGAALARQLGAIDRPLHVLTRRPASADFPPLYWHRGDLQDRELLARLLPDCKTVVHLASETTPGSSARHPTLEAGNLLPTLGLLEVLQDFPDIHLIYFSSGGTLYGNPAVLPVAEDAPFAPLSFHGAGKAAQEMYLQAFRAQGRSVTILRPANAYGPGQQLKNGFGLVRTMLEHIRRNTVLEVWGDGTAVRDYVYVDDVAAACVRFVDQPGDNGSYNVGSGSGHSISELIRCVNAVCSRELQVAYRPARRSDVAQVVLDISQLRATGWQPRIDLAEGLRRTWAWLQGQP